MMRSHARGLGIGLTVLLTLMASAGVAEVVKHSGTIVDYDPSTDTVVLEEVGPWPLRDGATIVTRQRIALTPQTEFVIAFRGQDSGGGRVGEFVEAPLDRSGVYVDDYVTLECRHAGGRMVALKITVLDLPDGTFVKQNSR